MASQQVEHRHEDRGPGRSAKGIWSMLPSCLRIRHNRTLATVKLEASLTALSPRGVIEAQRDRGTTVTVVNGHERAWVHGA